MGSVILTGSIADVKGFPAISVYSATKAAIRSFARTWTNELKDRRIRVNTISPGHIDTPIFDTWQQGDALTKMKEDLAKTVPLGRLGDPDEIAKAVSFLASHEASYVAESSSTSMAAWPRSNEEKTMSLKAELDAFRSEFMAQVPPEIREAMVRADMELAASGIAQRALKAGDRAPDFNLPDARGGYVRLKDLLATGPVVLSFYRGGWCPYCNLELRALQQALPEITRLGAKLVAVSPQTPDESLSTTEKNALSFSVLSDIGSTTAKSFGIAYDLAEELRPIYARSGHALPEKNGDESWVLPIPATYVIDTDGTVALAFVDVDYRNRLEPAEILTALQSLSKQQRGEHHANASR